MWVFLITLFWCQVLGLADREQERELIAHGGYRRLRRDSANRSR